MTGLAIWEKAAVGLCVLYLAVGIVLVALTVRRSLVYGSVAACAYAVGIAIIAAWIVHVRRKYF